MGYVIVSAALYFLWLIVFLGMALNSPNFTREDFCFSLGVATTVFVVLLGCLFIKRVRERKKLAALDKEFKEKADKRQEILKAECKRGEALTEEEQRELQRLTNEKEEIYQKEIAINRTDWKLVVIIVTVFVSQVLLLWVLAR